MRLQLALNVSELDEAIEFYSAMFDTPPARVREGYANWEIAEPPLKLVVFERPEEAGTLNHLGVEVDSAQQVQAAESRLSGQGLDTTGMTDTECCFATKTETWVEAPDSLRWEWYVRTGDSEQLTNVVLGRRPGTAESASAECACG